MGKEMCLQDSILSQVCKKELEVTIFLINGFQLGGEITGFDNFTIVLKNKDISKLIYKHAISTIISEISKDEFINESENDIKDE